MSEYFLLFAGDYHYPLGGMFDLKQRFNALDEAKAAVDFEKLPYDWAHIVRVDEGGLHPVCEMAEATRETDRPKHHYIDKSIKNEKLGITYMHVERGEVIPGEFETETYWYWEDVSPDDSAYHYVETRRE